MSQQTSLLILLMLDSAILCALMTLAWRAFGRPDHARLWAMAFGVACFEWSVNLAYDLGGQRHGWLGLLVAYLSIVVTTLWLEGFRRRAGRAPAIRLLVVSWAILAGLTAWCGTTSAPIAASFTIAMVARAILLCACASLVAPRRREANSAEHGTIAFLLIFSGFSLMLAAFALVNVLTALDVVWAIAISVLHIGIPIAFTGFGLFAVFLIASDLCVQMRDLAAADPLTGLLNRRGFDEAAVRSLAHARRHAQPVALAVTDIDYFKPINDRFGHAAGDRAIRQFATHLRASVRVDDLVSRTGGDEFVMLLLGTDGQGASEVVERLRDRLAQAVDADPVRFAASFGITEIAPGEPLEAALRRADDALYRSKQAGRDRATLAAIEPRIRPVAAQAA